MHGGDLYENVRMKPLSPRDAAAPASAAAPRRRALGPALALAALVALAASLGALGALYARAERELRALRAAAAGAPDASLGPRGAGPAPGGAPSCREPLEEVLQRLSRGWKYHGGKIYYFSTAEQTWGDAEAACASMNSHLATVSSAAEQEFLAREAGGEGHWIGLTDAGSEGAWRWADGTEYRQNASFWAPGQPDDWSAGPAAGEDCGHLQPEDSNLWNDRPCGALLRWVCAKALGDDGL